MAKKAKCKCKQEECEECPEWIFTFADLVMLMMGFFVILWVLKPNPTPTKTTGTIDDETIKVFAGIRNAFGYVPDPHSKDPIDIEMLLEKIQRIKIPDGPGDGGQTHVKLISPEGTDPEVTSIRPGKQATEGGKLLFDVGSSQLQAQTARSLDEIAVVVKGHRNIVMIKGHTSLDDFGDNATPQQKMDLSIRRAQAAADYLVAHGVEPELVRVQGCSTFEPLIQREYTPDSQSYNRRVEVEVSSTLVSDLQPQAAATQPAEALQNTEPATSNPPPAAP